MPEPNPLPPPWIDEISVVRVLPWAPWQAAGHRPLSSNSESSGCSRPAGSALLSLDTIDIWGQTVLLVGTVLNVAPTFPGLYPCQ